MISQAEILKFDNRYRISEKEILSITFYLEDLRKRISESFVNSPFWKLRDLTKIKNPTPISANQKLISNTSVIPLGSIAYDMAIRAIDGVAASDIDLAFIYQYNEGKSLGNSGLSAVALKEAMSIFFKQNEKEFQYYITETKSYVQNIKVAKSYVDLKNRNFIYDLDIALYNRLSPEINGYKYEIAYGINDADSSFDLTNQIDMYEVLVNEFSKDGILTKEIINTCGRIGKLYIKKQFPKMPSQFPSIAFIVLMYAYKRKFKVIDNNSLQLLLDVVDYFLDYTSSNPSSYKIERPIARKASGENDILFKFSAVEKKMVRDAFLTLRTILVDSSKSAHPATILTNGFGLPWG